MRALGFNYSKISVEKVPNPAPNSQEGLKINTNIEVTEISQVKADVIKTKDEFLGVRFVYSINYDPDYAKIEFSGDILIELDPKLLKDVLKEWKDKKMPEEFRVFVFNVIMRKSNVKALEIEDEMSLPFHIPMPFVTKESVSKKEE